ncbi:B-cell receptor-associated protein 31-like [Anopheles stephensi]|uniref:Endoplasmic reticulum transmembrane protein n=1 Tax=Anopheles stephensi TaxID=30069 RepID=A0A182YA26_ANOST|nr:B-cell receptor-associated protein 31-like [Anopheles stephensi]XP_035898624.1 B-cell receptor-associated protein 31-like [Anopheles stephensi]XP_035918335.1 B-cell receptor-associated protein 31-like [Anopheles stephensi]XP_035918336.1 B-cell receptor-associated protein 31-like [Anopheles stephensi]
MTLVWGIIASFLYVEIFVVLLLVLPLRSPQQWHRFFKSRFLAMLSRQAQTYFYLLLAVLVLFLLEAIREMRKYSSNDHSHTETHLNVEMQHSMRLFRAQRNFYISGFAIFLSLVIRRLVSLISGQAVLLAQAEASMKQAQSATSAARTLMNQQKDDDKKADAKDKPAGGDASNTEELKKKIAELEQDLAKERKDKEAMKSQSESLNREYDRLTEEYSKLQKKITISSADKSD